jgi:Acetyltransferase (GNAT) family
MLAHQTDEALSREHGGRGPRLGEASVSRLTGRLIAGARGRLPGSPAGNSASAGFVAPMDIITTDRSVAGLEGAPYAAPLTGGGDGGFVIRPAEPDDVPALVLMGHAFFQETGHQQRYGVQFDPASFAQILGRLGEAGVLITAERFGQPVGMAAIDIAPAYWNNTVKLAQEVFWYLKPEHRVGHGGRLLNALQQLARDKGAILFSVVAEEGDRSKALGRLYRSRGYLLAETVYRRML